jgi:hypothetical protein
MKTILFTTIFICLSLFFFFIFKTDKANAAWKSPALTFAENSLAGKIRSEPEEIVIDLKNGKKQLLDDFIDSVTYVKLETRDDNLIGTISQILFADSLLLIIDNENAKSIYIFDRQGHYKNRIGRIGNGPGEYVSIQNVSIVSNKNQIAVFDGWKKTIHFFNFNGNYLYSERMLFDAGYLEHLPSGYKVFDVTSMSLSNAILKEYRYNTLVVTNTNNEVMYGACQDFYNYDTFHYVMLHTLYRFGENVYYSPNFSNMIYQVGDSCLTAKYHINIKGGMPPLTDDITGDIFNEYSHRYAYFNGGMVEMKDFTYINLFTPQGTASVIYAHTKKQVYYTKPESMNPLFIFFTYADSQGMYQENTIITNVSAFIVNANKENLYKNIRHSVLDDLYKGLNEDDNPVLFFYHLKNNL